MGQAIKVLLTLVSQNMYHPYSIEEIQEEVLNTHGIYVPLEVIDSYQGVFPELSPEDLYCLVCSEDVPDEQPKVQFLSQKKAADLPKTEKETAKSDLYRDFMIIASVFLVILLLICFFAYA